MHNKDFTIGRKILKIGNQLINNRNNDLRKLNLTSNQSATLLFFDESKGSRILDLKEHLKISHQAARNIVERMKAKELLDIDSIRRRCPLKTNIPLRKKVRQSCRKLKKCGTSAGKTLLQNLTEKEKDILSKLLDKLSQTP